MRSANRRLARGGLPLAIWCWGVLAGCARPPAPPAPEEGVQPPPADARSYHIVPGQSEIRILVYRDGPLARLGHNHVISSNAFSGTVQLGAEPTAAAIELRLPVASLEVDRPELRRQEGPDFPGELDSAAIAGTRENMLGARVLDGAEFAEIRLVSRRVLGELPELIFEMEVHVRDGAGVLRVPATVEVGPAELRAAGRVSVAQTDLGLEPFSVMMGALSVRDELEIKFRVTARITDSSVGKPAS